MYCDECGKECGYVWENNGGSGEAWGTRYNDMRKIAVSDCCGADIYKDKSRLTEIDSSSLAADEYATMADWEYDKRREELMEEE